MEESEIKACINKVHLSIIVNQNPYGRIFPNRGLRQGDLISPFIFVLAMDYLSNLLNQIQKSKAIGVVFDKNCSLNHILFANDILLFIEDEDSTMRNFKNVLSL